MLKLHCNQKNICNFGGAGINANGGTGGANLSPIPQAKADAYAYGVCGITLAFSDYTDYSIAYQIYVASYGWVEAKSNGQECIYSKTAPMGAFRVAVIPTSELQDQLNTWNKDIGKKF